MAYAAINNLPAVHPGEILGDELKAIKYSATKFAKHIGVPTNAITEIIKGRRGISPEMAQRLAKAFRTTDKYWMNLQSNYDARMARGKMSKAVEAIEPLCEAIA